MRYPQCKPSSSRTSHVTCFSSMRWEDNAGMEDAPQDRLLRMKSTDGESVERKVGLRCSRIYELMKEQKFPQPTHVGGARLWSERELNTWISNQLYGRSWLAPA